MDRNYLSEINETCCFFNTFLIFNWKLTLRSSFFHYWCLIRKNFKLKKFRNVWSNNLDNLNKFISNIYVYKVRMFAYSDFDLEKILKTSLCIWPNENRKMFFFLLFYSLHSNLNCYGSFNLHKLESSLHYNFLNFNWICFPQFPLSFI